MIKRNITASDVEAAARLKAIYESKKKTDGLTQTDLKELTGFKQQSAVSQYLNAKIPLGVEAIFKFARALDVDPRRIKPNIYEELGLNPRKTMPVQVRCAINGTPTRLVIMTHEINNPDVVYAVLVDTKEFRPYKQGSHLLIDPSYDPVRGDDVYVEAANGAKTIGEYIGVNNHDDTIQIREHNSFQITEIKRSDVNLCDIIVGIQNPEIDRVRRER